MVHTEAMENGEVSTRPLRNATATDTLILSGNGPITWEQECWGFGASGGGGGGEARQGWLGRCESGAGVPWRDSVGGGEVFGGVWVGGL